MFKPKTLEIVNSSVSGQFEVKKLGWDIYVTTDDLTQSGGLIKELWGKTLKKVANLHLLKNKSWLVLGLATGTLVKLISDNYSPVKMVGVELDPEMIRVGKKYFHLDQIPNLEIVQIDAKRFVQNSRKKFDVVVVDLYIGDQLPKFVYQKNFLAKLDKLSPLIIVNHLIYDNAKRVQAEELVSKLRQVFPNIHLVRELTNLLVICS